MQDRICRRSWLLRKLAFIIRLLCNASLRIDALALLSSRHHLGQCAFPAAVQKQATGKHALILHLFLITRLRILRTGRSSAVSKCAIVGVCRAAVLQRSRSKKSSYLNQTAVTKIPCKVTANIANLQILESEALRLLSLLKTYTPSRKSPSSALTRHPLGSPQIGYTHSHTKQMPLNKLHLQCPDLLQVHALSPRSL